tara:strand:+ start:805 stop:1278 length:474 start_codon:yes stop_codon:yes gene_type:complete
MYILTFFTNNGTPATSLSPTVHIRNLSDNSLVVSGSAMSEVGDGFYKYNFTTYTGSVNYAIRSDGGDSLSGQDRYQFAGNENFVDDIWNEQTSDHTTSGSFGYVVNFINDIQGGRWKVVDDQMIFYKDDNTTEVARFNLFDSDGNATTTTPFERTRV